MPSWKGCLDGSAMSICDDLCMLGCRASGEVPLSTVLPTRKSIFFPWAPPLCLISSGDLAKLPASLHVLVSGLVPDGQ